jgi:hypothetical protein
MTKVILPVATDLWISKRDIEDSGIAVPGTIVLENYKFQDHEFGKSVQARHTFELRPSFVYEPGDPETEFRVDGVRDPNWIERATHRILDSDGNVVVEYVLHNHTKGFVRQFFDRPDPGIWHPTQELL